VWIEVAIWHEVNEVWHQLCNYGWWIKPSNLTNVFDAKNNYIQATKFLARISTNLLTIWRFLRLKTLSSPSWQVLAKLSKERLCFSWQVVLTCVIFSLKAALVWRAKLLKLHKQRGKTELVLSPSWLISWSSGVIESISSVRSVQWYLSSIYLDWGECILFWSFCGDEDVWKGTVPNVLQLVKRSQVSRSCFKITEEIKLQNSSRAKDGPANCF